MQNLEIDLKIITPLPYNCQNESPIYPNWYHNETLLSPQVLKNKNTHYGEKLEQDFKMLA